MPQLPAVGAATIRFIQAFDSPIFTAFSITSVIKSPTSLFGCFLNASSFAPSPPLKPLADRSDASYDKSASFIARNIFSIVPNDSANETFRSFISSSIIICQNGQPFFSAIFVISDNFPKLTASFLVKQTVIRYFFYTFKMRKPLYRFRRNFLIALNHHNCISAPAGTIQLHGSNIY